MSWPGSSPAGCEVDVPRVRWTLVYFRAFCTFRVARRPPKNAVKPMVQARNRGFRFDWIFSSTGIGSRGVSPSNPPSRSHRPSGHDRRTGELIRRRTPVQRAEPLLHDRPNRLSGPAFTRSGRQKPPLRSGVRGKIRSKWGGEFLASLSRAFLRRPFPTIRPQCDRLRQIGARENANPEAWLGEFYPIVGRLLLLSLFNISNPQ